MEKALFIESLMKGNQTFCEKVLKVSQDPKKMKPISELCEYVYELGMAEGLDKLLP